MILPIHIDKELKEKLRKLAEKNKTSMSGYIRNLILIQYVKNLKEIL
jgi:predicted transcriptional regulator